MLRRHRSVLVLFCGISSMVTIGLGPSIFACPCQVSAAGGEDKSIVTAGQPYNFRIERSCAVNPVQTQGNTGTCWSFATASFLESEFLRQGRGVHHLSEMFIVKNIYRDKARNYLLRSGKAGFSEGALAHDYLNAAAEHGLVPEEVYNGLGADQQNHDHGEMAAVLTGMLDSLAKRKSLSDKWMPALNNILDTYLGPSPERFNYQGQSYTPAEFANALGFRRGDYVSMTSYTHHPFGKPFVLEIPDNYSSGEFQNVPVNVLIATIDSAIANGYTVAWDGDVSEESFSSTEGIAVLPTAPQRDDLFDNIGPERDVTQADRQRTFMSYATTDDHLMHLVGISRDAVGNKYYVIKNSWGKVGPYEGYLHMSEAYARLKTVAIIVHKDVVVNRSAATP